MWSKKFMMKHGVTVTIVMYINKMGERVNIGYRKR